MNAILHIFTSLVLTLSLTFEPANACVGGKAATSMSNENKTQLAGQSVAIGNRLLVKFKSDLSEAEIDAINDRLGARVINRMLNGKLLLVEISYPDARAQIIEAYMKTKGVVYAEADQPVSIPEPPKEDRTPAPKQGNGPEDGSPPSIELPKVD